VGLFQNSLDELTMISHTQSWIKQEKRGKRAENGKWKASYMSLKDMSISYVKVYLKFYPKITSSVPSTCAVKYLG